MKKPECTEGVNPKENFEEGVKALFSVPTHAIVEAEKRKKRAKAVRASLRNASPTHNEKSRCVGHPPQSGLTRGLS